MAAATPTTSCTPKFSVLGEQSEDIVVVPTVVHKPNKQVFATMEIITTGVSETAASQEEMHRNDPQSILRALYCGVPSPAEGSPLLHPAVAERTAVTDNNNKTTETYHQHLVTLWKAVDAGTLRSLPMEYVPDGAALVQELQQQSISDTTIQLALAMYCGGGERPGVGVDDASSTSTVAAVFLGDLEEFAAQTIQEVPAVVEEKQELKKCEDTESPLQQADTTKPEDSVVQVEQLESKSLQPANDFVTSLLAKWKDVETGKLRSLPMEAPTPEQLQELLEQAKGILSSSSTFRYMEAMYGVKITATTQLIVESDAENNTSSLPVVDTGATETESNEAATDDDPVMSAAEQPNAIASEKPKDTTTVTEEEEKQETAVVEATTATREVLPVTSAEATGDESGDVTNATKEEVYNNKKTTPNNPVVIADPSELAALWSTVDAGTSKSLPIQDISTWSPTATKEFFDQMEANVSTVDLMDAMYQFSKHNDATVRDRYQELVARSSSNTTTTESVPDRITVMDSSSGEDSPAVSMAEETHGGDSDEQQGEEEQAPVEDELLVDPDPAASCLVETRLDEVVPAPDTPIMSPSQLSRANTPILSNRTADKELSNDTYGARQLLEQVHEENSDQHLSKQPESPTPVRPAAPSYSEMAKKIASVTTPKKAVTIKPVQASAQTTVAPVPKTTGKRFVASLSAVVGEKSSSSAPPTPSRGLESLQAPIIVLYSSQATHAEVIRQQTTVRNALTEQGIKHEAVDGASHKAIRTALFELSGRIGEYPQIFEIQDSTPGQKSFWGGYERFVVDDSLGVDISSFATTTTAPVIKKAKEVQPKRSVRFAASKKSNKMSDSKDEQSLSTGKPPLNTTTKGDSTTKSEITFYGATSFVAKHALDYMMQVSLTIPGVRKITLAGRNETKVNALKNTVKEKMGNLCAVNPKHKGKCVFDVFICDSSDEDGLRTMCQRTKVVANFAGPFERFSSTVVAACAAMGTDYVDITGEVHWAGTMRLKYGELAEKSGARIISFCGFDSIPSDLAIFGAVDALKKKSGGQAVVVHQGTCWHHCLGMANGGTIQTTVEMPLNIRRCLLRWVPFLLEDPLALAHPRIRLDKESEAQKNRMAWAEWMNQLPSMDAIFHTGFSGPFFMAPLNTKIVNASSVALEYGPKFTYRERFIPLGFTATRGFGFISLIPVLAVQCMVLLAGVVLKFPVLGGMVARWALPAGTGSSDQACQEGFCEVYAEVQTEPNAAGKVDRGNCVLRFEGDPGNWTTAQCICESALTLVLDRQRLPPRSADGFGTPAELLGAQLVKRLKQTMVRPVEIATYVRKDSPAGENFLCHFK